MNSQQQAINQELFSKQLNQISQEAAGNDPLIGKIEEIQILQQEFEENIPFLQKLFYVQEYFPKIRRVRRDGSCFYRGYFFQICEEIISKKDKTLQNKLIKIIQQSEKDLKDQQFDECVIKDFQNTILEMLQKLLTNNFTINNLLESFNDKFTSDSLVMYLRFLTSAYLKKNAKQFENYLLDDISIEDYCAIEIDPIDKEADQLAIISLINYINIPLKIVYMDSNPQKTIPDIIVLPEGENKNQNSFKPTFLYRPGHYDIIYKQ